MSGLLDLLNQREQQIDEAVGLGARKENFEFDAKSSLKSLPYNPAHPKTPGVDFWKELGFPSPMMRPEDRTDFLAPHNEAALPAPVALAAARMNDPLNRDLAAAEHGAFAQSLVDQYGPLGRLMLLGAVPGYQGAKFAAQRLPGGGGLDRLSRATLGLPLAGPNTTAPGWDQLKAGLRPAVR